MGLLVISDIRETPSHSTSVSAMEVRIKAVRSSCLPGRVLIKELAISQNAMSVFTKNEIAHISEMGNSASCPDGVVRWVKRAICGENV